MTTFSITFSFGMRARVQAHNNIRYSIFFFFNFVRRGARIVQCVESTIHWDVCRLPTFTLVADTIYVFVFSSPLVFIKKIWNLNCESIRFNGCIDFIDAAATNYWKLIRRNRDLDTTIFIHELVNTCAIGRRKDKTHNKFFVDSIHCHFHMFVDFCLFTLNSTNEKKKNIFLSVNVNDGTKQKNTTEQVVLAAVCRIPREYSELKKTVAFLSDHHFKPFWFFLSLDPRLDISIIATYTDDNLADEFCLDKMIFLVVCTTTLTGMRHARAHTYTHTANELYIRDELRSISNSKFTWDVWLVARLGAQL